MKQGWIKIHSVWFSNNKKNQQWFENHYNFHETNQWKKIDYSYAYFAGLNEL